MAKTVSASKKLVSTGDYVGVRVVEAGKKNDKRVGKVYRFVFHPTEKRVVGFLVKRPDLLLMFHRKDSFVALDGFHIEDGRVMINDDKEATGNAAVKRLGLDWDNCVLWIGMPVVTKSGAQLGYVGNVAFDIKTGVVDSFDVDTGAMNDAIVGKITIPAAMVRGFKRGVGTALAEVDEHGQGDETAELGAILVDDAAADIQAVGGAAEAAGEAVAVASDKAHKAVETAKPKVQEASRAAGEAVEKGVHATGKQLGKSKKMFADFKDEFDKALNEGEPAASPKAAVSSGKSEPAAKAAADSADSAADGKDAGAPAASVAAAGEGAATKKASSSAPAKKTSTASTKASSSGSAKKPAAKKPAAKKSSASAAQALGKQLGRASGMFSAFKEEYDKARKDD